MESQRINLTDSLMQEHVAERAMINAAKNHRTWKNPAEFEAAKSILLSTATDADTLRKKSAVLKHLNNAANLRNDIFDPDTQNPIAKQIRAKAGNPLLGVVTTTTVRSYDQSTADTGIDTGWMMAFDSIPGETMLGGGKLQVMTKKIVFTVKTKIEGKPMEFQGFGEEAFRTLSYKTEYIAITADTAWLATNSFAKSNDLIARMREARELALSSKMYTEMTKVTNVIGTETFSTSFVNTVNNAALTLFDRNKQKGYAMNPNTPMILWFHPSHAAFIDKEIRAVYSTENRTLYNLTFGIQSGMSFNVPKQPASTTNAAPEAGATEGVGTSASNSAILMLPKRDYLYVPVSAPEENQKSDWWTGGTDIAIKWAEGQDVGNPLQAIKVPFS